jgi:hypothetical protein
MPALGGNGEDSYPLLDCKLMAKGKPLFTKKEKLAIGKEGKKTGVETVCAEYDIS